MATYIGIGFSREPNTTAAARDAALQARNHIQRPDLTIVFTTIPHSPWEALRVVRQTLGDGKLIGCSTAAILFHNLEPRGLAVMTISSDEIKFATSYAGDLSAVDMRVAGAELARKTSIDLGENKRSVFFLFCDGLFRNHFFLLKGIQEVLGRVFPILGADSSDYFRFKETYQFFDDKPLTRSVVGMMVGGHVSVGFAGRHGWKPLGKPRLVTKTDGALIKTIDDKKASLLYEEYLGLSLTDLQSADGVQSCYSYPLGSAIEGEKEYLLRNIVGISEDGGLIAQGEVKEGAEIHLMITNKDFLKQAAIDAAYEVKAALNREPKFILIFESLARWHLLGREAGEEIAAIREILGANVPVLGMASYGTMAPLKSLHFKGESFYHNGSIMIVALG